jgi:hypothetical protein
LATEAIPARACKKRIGIAISGNNTFGARCRYDFIGWYSRRRRMCWAR